MMRAHVAARAALVLLLAATSSAQDAKGVIAEASKAMGVDSLKTVSYSATGYDFALGQSPTPGALWPRFIEKSYTRAVDFERRASKVDRVRLQGENPPRGGGQQPIVGEQTQSQTIIIGPETPWAQQLEIWMLPHGFLRAAAARSTTVETRPVNGQPYRVLTFTGDNRAKVSGYINAKNQVERVETAIDHAVLGDMPLEAVYSDYRNTGGYAVIAIDFKDYIALIECGQSEGRGLAVIAEAKRLIPNKPIRYVVNTHSHFDHASGLRAFVAEGSTILTHEANKDYLAKVLSLPHTLNPDKAQTAGRAPIVEAMGDKKVLTDGTHVVELYHLQRFGHHNGMIVAYLPKEKVLLEADGYNPQATTAVPPNTASPYQLSLLENIERLKLDVHRIVPVHYPADNRVVTLQELRRWVGRGSGN